MIILMNFCIFLDPACDEKTTYKCGNECGDSCPDAAKKICQQSCKYGCHCKTNYKRHAFTNQCIRTEECPTCPRNIRFLPELSFKIKL